jgi:serine/threonine protein kinase/tetratricopeptide (TPR) repeat protein
MPVDPKLVRDHFLAAVELAPAERAAYLTAHCGEAELRAAVERLLAAHDQPAAVLNRPVLGDLERTGAFIPGDEPGAVIAGRYKLLEQIGEGGMGSVWVAEQTAPVRRKVALKLIKAGMDSKSVLARFEAERQALAVMDHPNIAKVLDGGITETGKPFFVMEYVKGVPITEYCDATRLSVPERLTLFTQVCSAVQHAHQKGIIHRDLKPSNILVAPYDDKPVPKVIDFGLAKAMHQSLTERTLHTAHETVLGTPLYMSPEQAQFNNLDVDTRSDIYSLGVLLYELLTGTTPLDQKRFKEAAWDEIKRIIREEDPPRPSTRLSSTNTLPSLAAIRQTEPARLRKLVRGELDWIVMRALEKDRARRYETANGLAMDIQRYLHGEPVLAAPPSVRYRVRKFVQKHRAGLLTTSALTLLLLGGAVTVFAVQSKANRERAAEVADRAVREAGTTASVAEAVREARERTEEAWNLGDDPERMGRVANAAVLSLGRADGFIAAGTPTDATLAEVVSARKLVDELARYSRLIASCEASQRQFADDLNKATRSPRTKLALRFRGAFLQFGLDPIEGDAEEAARTIANSRLRDSLLGYLLLWHLHAEQVSASRQKYPDRVPDSPTADPLLHQRLMQVIRSARKICGGEYARWQDLLDRKDIPGLVAFAGSPQALTFRAPLINDLGRDLLRAEQYPACRGFLRAAAERYPHDVWLQFDLFSACSQVQPPDWPEALRHVSAASVQWPDCALFRLQMGECYLGLGSYDLAIAAFEKANSIYADTTYVAPRISAARSEKAKDDAWQAADLIVLQGKWERVTTTEGGRFGETARAVKEIKGNSETVTWYDRKGAVLRSHRVAIRLAKNGKVKTFWFSDIEILHGPDKGQKLNVTGTYVYALDKDTFYEAHGALEGDGAEPPSFSVWKRVKGGAT